MICPRCDSEEFKELDCGNDTWDDDCVWTSYICKRCGLYYSGWRNKWLIDCEVWVSEEDAKEFIEREKLLFVCECNLNRSPTFEKYFKEHYKQFEVKSTGTQYGYPEKINEKLLEWADKIFTMDWSQTKFIKEHYPEFFNKVVTIGISDQYDVNGEELIELIKLWSQEYFKEH